MLKFSVLIPTRNRLEFLKYAVFSVLQQSYENWEVIVSDNDSEVDVESYVKSLGDERVKYFRTASFVPVTDNWNNALEKSTGDYIIMLGDDDSLLKDYFVKCIELIQKYESPEMIYTSALLYTYPNVVPGCSEGSLVKWPNACFLSSKKEPFILSNQDAIRFVKDTLNFTIMFNFNAQFSLVRRSLINDMKKYGPFYQSPYPDYYSTTALFIKAKRILAISDRMIAVGVSPKSFGYYYVNNKEKQGLEFLKNLPNAEVYQKVSKYIMPGTNMNSSWLLANETIKINFNGEFDFKVSYYKYRFLQVLQIFKKFACHEGANIQDLKSLTKVLFWWEKILYLLPIFTISLCIRKSPKKNFGKGWANRMLFALSHPQHGELKALEGRFENITDVFEKISITNF